MVIIASNLYGLYHKDGQVQTEFQTKQKLVKAELIDLINKRIYLPIRTQRTIYTQTGGNIYWQPNIP